MKAVKGWNIYLIINALFLLPTFIGGVINYQFYDLIPKAY